MGNPWYPRLFVVLLLVQIVAGCSNDAGPHFTLDVSPKSLVVLPGTSCQFVARVDGTPSHQVGWALDGEAAGTVTDSGLYNAPSAPGSYRVRVSSLADPRATVDIPVTVTANLPAWTVMVYMAADNNLEGEAISDLNEMESVGSTEQVRVVVQLDRSPRFDTSNGNWTGARRFQVQHDDDPSAIDSVELARLGPTNSLADANARIDGIIAAKRWIVPLMHGVGDSNYYPVTVADLASHLDYVQARRDRIWIDTYANVAGYVLERDLATIQVLSPGATTRRFALTTPLDPAAYDVALTVVAGPLTYKPAGVSASRKLSAGVRMLPVSVVPGTIAGTWGILVDAVPGQEPISLSWKIL